MKKFYKIFASCILLVGMSSCSTERSESFVQVMIVPEKCNLSLIERRNEKLIMLQFEGGDLISHDQEFQDYCARYGDLNYNKRIPRNINQAYAPELTAINVTCDRAIMGFEAGESLNSIIRLHAYSAYNYINRGYRMRSDAEYYPPKFIAYDATKPRSGFQPVTMMLDNLNLNDLKLIENFAIFLQFTEHLPQGDYVLKVSVTTEKGTISENLSVAM